MMDNPAETGILSGEPFSHQYEVNSNEKVYSEGTTSKAETGGEMEKTSGETRDADGGGVLEEDGFGSVGMEGKGRTDAGNGLGDGEGHVGDGPGDDDVVMADVDAEDGYVGGAGGDVQEKCIGNGGLDQAQPAVLENGKQNGRQCDPFASPDDQPMPQAESPAVQNIYDLQSSWPQQPHADNGDTLGQPDDHLNQEETIPEKAIGGGYDDERGQQEYPEETSRYSYSEQSLEEDQKDKVGDTGSGDYLEQEVVEKEQGIPIDQGDPYGLDRVDQVEEKDFETEKDTSQESLDLNLQEAAVGTALATEVKGDHLQQVHLDPQFGDVEQVIEKKKDDEEEHLNLQEAAVGTALATEVTRDHPDTREAVTDDAGEQVIEKEEDTEEEHLNVQEESVEDHIEQKDFGTEKETVQDLSEPLETETTDNVKQEYSDKQEDLPKDNVDSFEVTQDNSEQTHFKSKEETQEGLVDSHDTKKLDNSEQKDIEKEIEITKAYQDPYDVTDADQQVTTTIHEEPVETSGDPYLSEQVPYGVTDVDQQITTLHQEPVQASGDPGLNKREEVPQPSEVNQDYPQGSVEAAPTNESEVYVDQEELQEEVTQEYPSEKVDSVEKVKGDKEEDIARLSEAEHRSESIEIGKGYDSENQDMEQVEVASHIPQESVSPAESSSMQKPIHSEGQVDREVLGLENQVQAEEEQEPEELLDPYAPENADMAESAVTSHAEDSVLLGDQPAQQDNIPQEYNDPSLTGENVGTKETGFGFSAMAPSEDKDIADKNQMLQDDLEFAQTLDSQAESRNMQPEMPTDPIDAVFKANSQENLLGLDPEAAVCETKQDEPPSENLESVLESDQKVTTSQLVEQTDESTLLSVETQPEVVHEPINVPSNEREDVNVDLSNVQDTVVSAEVDTESFQSGSVIESSDPLIETQPEVVHEPINVPSNEREDVNVDLSNVQDTVVSAEVDTESFQSGSVIESSDPLVSQGLSEIDIEPSQQIEEDISIPTVPDKAHESDYYDGGECQEEIIGADESAEQVEPSRSETEYDKETIELTSQGKAANLPLLDLGDGPVQSLSIADADQSPGQRSFEGSFSPIEDNVAVSLALEDQSHVVESKDREESDDDAHTETTEVEAEVHEDKVEQEIQHEEESTYNTLKEVPNEAGGHEEESYDKTLDEGKDTSETAQSLMTNTNIDETNDGLVPDQAEISPKIPDTMQAKVETYSVDNEKASEEYNQVHPELPEDSMASVDVGVEESMNISDAAEASQEVSPELCEQDTPDIVMQEYSEEAEAEQASHTIPDVSTDTTLQNTADKLLGDPEEADALILERSRGSVTPPNTPEVISSSPPEMVTHQALDQEPMQREDEAIGDEVTPEAEQLALYDDQIVQSEQKQEPPAEEPVLQEDEEVQELVPEEAPPAASISEEKQSSPEVTAPSIPLSVHTPEVPKATPAPVVAKEGDMKSGSPKQKKSKAPTDIRSPSKRTIPSAAPKSKSAGKPKGSDTPKKTAALSRSQPRAPAPADRKETTKAPSKSPAKTPSKTPSKTPTKLPAASKTPVKASPKVTAPSPARPTSAKKTPGQASVGATHTRPKTAPPKVDSKPSESKPKQDKIKMSGVKQKTVTTVTKTTHTEVKSAKSSPRKSADGDSPRVRHSPGRNGVSSKIGSLDNSRHSPGGGNVRIQSEKSNYSKVQSRCGSLGNATHRAGGGNVKIFDEKVDFRTRANSRVGSLDNAHHSPGGGNVQILHDPVTFSKPSSRVGSLENAHHSPHGGKVKFLNNVYSPKSKEGIDRLDRILAGQENTGTYVYCGWSGCVDDKHYQQGEYASDEEILHDPVAFPKSSVSSKIGSLDNAQHSPGGGNVKIASASVDFSKKAKSKIGSLDNAHHSPKGGNVKISNQSADFSKSAKSKIGSLDNATHTPGGGNVKILNQSADFTKSAKSKIGSLDNATHTPGGGNVKIMSQSADYSKTVKSKIGSLDNATHSPGGGKVKIENKKVDYSKKVTSKIGSLNNATHKPGGGNVKIEKKKLDFKEKAASKIGSKDNIKHQAGGGQVKIENKKLDFKDKATSKVGSKDNIEHKPGGGQVKIQEEKLEFKTKASSKIGSLDNANHKPGGGEVQILDEKVDFGAAAQSKVGSLDNADHQPTGGDVKIFDEKPTFQHVSPRTDDGIL